MSSMKKRTMFGCADVAADTERIDMNAVRGIVANRRQFAFFA